MIRRLLTGLFAATFGVWLLLGAALAQDTPDYDRWASLAERAEDVLERGLASTSALETLREQVAGFREQFLDGQDANAARIETLRGQIEALGPVPEEGEESQEIAERRAELQEQLDRLMAPRVAAEEAYTRADGLIREIDDIIRERQTDALLSLGPTPVDPRYWPGAVEALWSSVGGVWQEGVSNWASPIERRALASNLPLVLGLLLVAAILFLRGNAWVERAGERMRGIIRRGSGVWSVLISFGHIVLPLAGLYAITWALRLSGLAGLRGEVVLEHLPEWGVFVLGVRWIAGRIFHSHDRDAHLPLEALPRAEARWYATVLALLVVIHSVISAFGDLDNLSEATLAVLVFPVVVLIGLLLFRLGQILRRFCVVTEEDTEEEAFRDRLIRLVGLASMIVAVLAPVMAGIGYRNAAVALLLPWVSTLALAGLLMVLQRFLGDVYRLVTGKSDADTESLVPVLIGFVLALGTLPALALIWGARVADLTEIWTRFREGFVLGETRISPTDFLTFVIVFVLGYTATRFLQGALRSSVLPKTRIDLGGQNAIVSGMGYVGILLAALLAISAAGLDLSSLAIVAGALSVGIGFGLQNIVSNFVSGIILLIERPVSEGDWIEVGGQMGYVRAISVRSTRIETFDRTDVIIPNADLVSGVVTNWTRNNTVGRVIVPVGVAYGTDSRKVEAILREIAEDHPMVLLNPAPSVVFRGFGADSLDFEIRAILRDVNWALSVHSDMNHAIARRFAEEGIEIPFAQRDVWLRNPEVLRAPAGTPETPEPSDRLEKGGRGDPAGSGTLPETMRPLDADEALGDASGGDAEGDSR
ncbi:MAG: DUF3772 domain-containing protein [Paracoccaceae bacterium]